MRNTKDYFEEYSRQLQSDFSFERVLIRSRRQKVLASIEKHPHKSILEIGCGLDPMFPYCKNFEHYTIVEPSEEFIKHASKLADKNEKITIKCGNFEDVFGSLVGKFEFDFIILSSVLHEVPDPNKLLKSVYHICRDETLLHINVPNARSFHRVLAYEMGLIQSLFEKSELGKKLQRNTSFDKEALFKIVEKNGFKVLSFETYQVKPFTNEQMEKIVKKNIVDKSIMEGLERMIKYLPEMGCEMFVNVKKK